MAFSGGVCWNLNVLLSNFGPVEHKKNSKQFILEILQGKTCPHSFFQGESIFHIYQYT